MSSPAQPGPSVPKEEKEKKGLQKFVSRMKTVLKKPDGSRRLSMMGSSKTPKPSEAPEDKGKEPAQEKTKAEEEEEGVIKIPRSQLFEQRAKELSERFGLQLQPSEWHQTEDMALRKEKPIRMRVRRTCHKCESTFGVAKECPSCGHTRCTKCVRYPPKRTEEEKEASRQRRLEQEKAKKENPPIAVDWRYDVPEIVLKKPRKQGGQDLVHKKPRQRIRRNCHECGALFATGSKECSCGHIRCTDCPRDPAKKDKYPFGYPGDEFGPNAVPHHECHKCKAMFPGGAADGTECVACKHPKCDQCRRLKPRRVEPQLDPEVLKSVQAKIANLKLGE